MHPEQARILRTGLNKYGDATAEGRLWHPQSAVVIADVELGGTYLCLTSLCEDGKGKDTAIVKISRKMLRSMLIELNAAEKVLKVARAVGLAADDLSTTKVIPIN